MNRTESCSCQWNGATTTEPIAHQNGVSVPIAERKQAVSERHRLDSSVEFAELVKLVKEQAQAEDADIGMIIDGKFTRARPICRASIDPEKRLEFLQHIEEVLRETQSQLPNEKEFHQSSTTKSWTSFPDDQT